MPAWRPRWHALWHYQRRVDHLLTWHFTNALEADPRSREVSTFHRPEELIRLLTLDQRVRGLLREMPPLNPLRMWQAQVASVQNLETSLAEIMGWRPATSKSARYISAGSIIITQGRANAGPRSEWQFWR